MYKIIVLFLITVFWVQQAQAQYSSIKIKEKHQAYTDSLKQVQYDNIFPIWGQKAYQKGFDIPYPTGIMTNIYWMKQRLIVENLRLGVKRDNVDAPLTPVDFIEFADNFNESSTIIVRPDLWIFPFLNVYGIFGYGQSKTEVNLSFPVELTSEVDQSISTAGFGATAAAGLGPVWLAIDGNISWSKPELLDDPVEVNTFGIRLGHNFVSKHKPYRNFGIWAGAMKVSLQSNTEGQLKLKDALPPETFERADQIVMDYNEWLDSLNPLNPIDARKIEIANRTLTPIIDRIAAADGEAILRYGLDKRAKEEWNGILGAQYQLNKNWMFRAEGGIIGDRKSMLLSINYRFLL